MSKRSDQLDRIERKLNNIEVNTAVAADEANAAKRAAAEAKQVARAAGEAARMSETLLTEAAVTAVQNTKVLDELEAIIDREVVVSFGYESLDGEGSTRIVSPYEVIDTSTGPHLFGFDHVRQDVRQYALRRMTCVVEESRFEFIEPEDDE